MIRTSGLEITMSLTVQAARIRVVLPALLLAVSAAAREADRVVLVADSRRYSGWEAWWANLYNDSRFSFAILTILIIPGLALVLARLTDLVLARVGINLRSRVVSER